MSRVRSCRKCEQQHDPEKTRVQVEVREQSEGKSSRGDEATVRKGGAKECGESLFPDVCAAELLKIPIFGRRARFPCSSLHNHETTPTRKWRR
jgi:hypothetical protein